MIKRVEIVTTAPGAREANRLLDDLAAKVKALGRLGVDVKVNIDGANTAVSKMAALRQTLVTTAGKPVSFAVNADTARAAADLSAFSVAARAAGVAAGDNFASGFKDSAAAGGFGGFLTGLLSGLGFGAGKGRGGVGWLRLGAVPLFGGLGAVGGLHLLADAIIEVGATLIPATIAFGAFALASNQAVELIKTHMTDLLTVVNATGQNFGVLAGGFHKLQNAAQPHVFEIWGDAVDLASTKTGILQKMIGGAGNALDQLAARATVALKSGGGAIFLQNAVADLAKWGDALGNLFGIIGNLIRAMPGYANVLLTFFDDFTHGIEVVTGSKFTQWLITAGVGLHGFFLYAGLAASGIAALMPLASRLITGLAGLGANGYKASTALSDLGTSASDIQKSASKVTFFDKIKAGYQDIIGNTPVVIGRLRGVGAAEQAVGERTGFLGRAASVGITALSTLGRILPIAGIAALGVTVVAVAEDLHHVNNATAQWIDSMQVGLQKAPLTKLLPEIRSDISAIQNALNNHPSKSFIIAGLDTGDNPFTNFAHDVAHDWDEVVSVFGVGVSKAGELRAALSQLDSQDRQVSAFIGSLGRSVGGLSGGLGLLSAAGITSQQVLNATAAAAHGNYEPMLILRQEVDGVVASYKSMQQTGGILGNDLQMLDKQASEQYTAMQTLNQGWDTFIGNMTAGQSNFDNFALGMKTLGSSASTLSHHLADGTLTINGYGRAIDGLSKKDLELNQAFTQQVVNANASIDTWRQAGVAANLFKGGVQGAVAQLLPFAKGSTEATAQLVGLAQEAGYDGPASFSALSKWVGNTHDALQKMKDAANQATIQEGLLTTSMHAQGNYIANQLIGDINQAILKYYGVQKAAEAYGNAVAKDGQQSDQAHAARQRLINDIIASGQAAHDSTNKIAAMITKVLGIPTKAAIRIVETGVGHYSINSYGGTSTSYGSHYAHRSAQGGNARGALIRAGTTATADDVIARVSRGELIVPAHMVRAGMVDHLRGTIPGFAAGGFANPSFGYNFGSAAVGYNNHFVSTMTSAMESAITAATKSAIAAASMSFGPGAGGLSGTAQHMAMAMLARYGWGGQWAALNSVAMRESGWSMTARNPSSGAYGIAQFINGPGEYAQYGGNAYSLAGQLTAFFNYIRSRYGNPDNAWAHEMAFGWYDHGGVLKPGWTMALNTTGHDEMVSSARGFGSSHGSGGDTYHISVNGDTDPDGAALRIIQTVKRYKGRHGNQPLGIA